MFYDSIRRMRYCRVWNLDANSHFLEFPVGLLQNLPEERRAIRTRFSFKKWKIIIQAIGHPLPRSDDRIHKGKCVGTAHHDIYGFGHHWTFIHYHGKKHQTVIRSSRQRHIARANDQTTQSLPVVNNARKLILTDSEQRLLLLPSTSTVPLG